MKHEFSLSRGQLKGYLFEIVILELLLKNNFNEIHVASEPRDRVRENRKGFIELKGRGCWHQIDCPCDYNQLIPFSYPLRLLGEVKFYKTPLEKKYIREYIGVIRDIQENYFVTDGIDERDIYPRKMEIGAYFSANGFQAEAEKLAYAHGIKTISYANNHLVDHIKNLIEELEENFLSVKCMKDDSWSNFKQEFIRAIRYGANYNTVRYYDYLRDGYITVINEIHNALVEIHSSFIATTATGVFLHFVGNEIFPEELFRESDNGNCRVYYNQNDNGIKYFWLEISGDNRRRRFYFTPPESLDVASIYGGEFVLNEKERLFRVLNINIRLNGITRNLTLHLDRDWLDVARNNN